MSDLPRNSAVVQAAVGRGEAFSNRKPLRSANTTNDLPDHQVKEPDNRTVTAPTVTAIASPPSVREPCNRLEHRQIVYRLLPQKRRNWRRLERLLEGQRQLYNAALEERIDCYRKTGRTVTYIDQAKSLTMCRRDLAEMASVGVGIQRGTLRRLDEAFKGFFRRAKKGGAPGFPRFKGRRLFNSLSIIEGVKVEADRVRIPSFGWLRIRRRGGNPYPDGKPVSAVLKREGGKWYAVVCFAVALPEPVDNGHAIGVDMNAGQVADSDGRIHDMPDMRRLEARKRRYSRKLARQRRGSRRRERTRERLAKTHRRIAMKRRDWHHHVSRRLANDAGTVVIEDLPTRNMTRSAKGTVEQPGRRVKQKAGLNRVILNTGWSALRQMLKYKAAHCVAVNPAYTSRTCRACGHVDAGSRRSRSEFECTACGHADHADLNAAANILASGTGATARGGCRNAGPANRENVRRAA